MVERRRVLAALVAATCLGVPVAGTAQDDPDPVADPPPDEDASAPPDEDASAPPDEKEHAEAAPEPEPSDSAADKAPPPSCRKTEGCAELEPCRKAGRCLA